MHLDMNNSGLSRRRNTHLLTLGLATVSPHNQIVCLLADIASYFSSITLNQGLGLISFNTLQNASNYERQAFQAIFSSLRTRALQEMPLPDAILPNTCFTLNFLTPYPVKYSMEHEKNQPTLPSYEI